MFVTNEIAEVLNLRRWGDLLETDSGMTAKARPDIAEFANEITVFAPPPLSQVTSLYETLTGIHKPFIDRLYSLCNGMRIGATKFSVFGFRANSSLGSPLDLNDPNYYSKPFGLEKGEVILGTNRTWESGKSSRYYHVLDSLGCLRIISESSSKSALRMYNDVDKWLVSETGMALEDTEHF